MSEFSIKLEEFQGCPLDKGRSNEYNEKVLFERDLSSAGRASALQAEGHRFEPYRSHFHEIPVWHNMLYRMKTKYGEVAQLARARGSYPRCRRFKSVLRYLKCVADCSTFFLCYN